VLTGLRPDAEGAKGIVMRALGLVSVPLTLLAILGVPSRSGAG